MIFSKFFLFLSAAFCIIFSISSCSNEFELTEGDVDIPIVYGVISTTDTATYIRVERAFISEETSAYVLSKDPDQLYYKDITVKLKHVKSGKEFTLYRVDGNLEGYQRSPGAFADAPNYLYKIKKSELNLIPKDDYTLIVSHNDGQVLTEATTTVIAPYQNADITNPGPTALLSLINNSDFKIRWFGDPNAVIHDIQLVINFKEEKGGNLEDKSVVWTIVKNHDKNEYSLKGRLFYEFLQGALDKDPLKKRYFQHASLIVVSGGQAIKDYISIGQANLGITSSGEIPVYSNLSKDGQGIFSSKTSFIRTDIGLAQGTLDSLRGSVLTKSLNFQ
ncbi:MAG: DUF4249 family protein [Saprospiraceae bacterium]|nr:DUF4249 family protein [Saprospiraceae bacterium]